MKYVALCCIAKDEDRFLKEWLAYHSLIGFEHFFIYDNSSARPIADLLGGFAEADRLTVLRSNEERTQRIAYSHCLASFGRDFHWIAFLDLDEFIRISPNRGLSHDVRELLAAYEPYAGLGLNWRMFSSSGHEKSPSGLVIEEYTRYHEDDPHIKSIVQPGKTEACAGPHSFYPLKGHYAVNAEHFPIPGGFPASFPAMKEACVNHYYFKSREDFEGKIARGNPCNIVRSMEEFDRHLTRPTKNDSALTLFAGEVRKALEADRLPAPSAAKAAIGGESASLQKADACPDAASFLASARHHYKNDRLREANLCLCYAALCNAACQDGGPDGREATLAAQQARPAVSSAKSDCGLRYEGASPVRRTRSEIETDESLLLQGGLCRPQQTGQAASARHDGGPDGILLAIWTLRASIARKQGRNDLAEFFLRQAFTLGASLQAHTELAGVMHSAGRVEESRRLVDLIRIFNTL